MTKPLMEQQKTAKATKEGASQAAGVILDYLAAACYSGEELSNAVCGHEEGLRQLLTAFSADYGSGAEKWVSNRIYAAPATFAAAVRKAQNSAKPAGGSIWTKLFQRK